MMIQDLGDRNYIMGAAYAKTMNGGDRLGGLAKKLHDKE